MRDRYERWYRLGEPGLDREDVYPYARTAVTMAHRGGCRLPCESEMDPIGSVQDEYEAALAGVYELQDWERSRPCPKAPRTNIRLQVAAWCMAVYVLLWLMAGVLSLLTT